MGSFEEFAEIVTRRLGATEVRLVAPERSPDLTSVPPTEDLGQPPPPQVSDTAPRAVVVESRLASGTRVIASFDSPPEPVETLQEGLDELVASFAMMLESSARQEQATLEQAARPLRQLLAGLAQRAGATEVVIIDAHSPAVWGVAHGDARPLEQDPEPPDNVLWLHGSKRHNRAEEAARCARAAELGVGVADTVVVDPRVLALLPSPVGQRYRVLPLYQSKHGLLLATSDPLNFDAIRDVVMATGLEVEPVFVSESLIQFVNRWNGGAARRSATTDDPPPASSAPTRQILAEDTLRRLSCRYAAREVIRAVRAAPEMPTLRKGGHLHKTLEVGEYSVIVRSFGTIYVLVVILPARFNELQAKHAINQALPVIESLVVSLPPRSPLGPQGAAQAALRRRT